jgi:predicted ATPase
MITRIEIDGFKTFKDFAIDLAPFQVIVGMNGVGKSNFLDAIRFLSDLTHSVSFGPNYLGGTTAEQAFTILPNNGNNEVKSMHFAVEMLVAKKVVDSLGEEVDLKTNRLRYELSIFHTPKRMEIKKENLFSIPFKKDNWARKYKIKPYENDGWLSDTDNTKESLKFISTETEDNISMLMLHKDGSSSERKSRTEKAQVTLLSTVNSSEFPHVLATKEEMRKWKILRLNPEELRTEVESFFPNWSWTLRSNNLIPTKLPEYNLLDTLYRMKMFNETNLKDVVRDFSNLVPGFSDLNIWVNNLSGKYALSLKTQDGRDLSWQLLSDGSLRMLGLATLANDIYFQGLIGIEEPENNVHPALLSRLARLLKSMATDFNDPEQKKLPLRQVFITTHSPVFISQPEVVDSLLYTYMPTYVSGKKSLPMKVTRMTPVIPRHQIKEGEEKISYYTLDQIKGYLLSKNYDEALTRLGIE